MLYFDNTQQYNTKCCKNMVTGYYGNWLLCKQKFRSPQLAKYSGEPLTFQNVSIGFD